MVLSTSRRVAGRPGRGGRAVDADGFQQVQGRRQGGRHLDGQRCSQGVHGSGNELAQGVRAGDVPEWSCHCGIAHNWGSRLSCRGCGRRAPERTLRAQRDAADHRRLGTAKSGASAEVSLRRQVQQLEVENAKLRVQAEHAEPEVAKSEDDVAIQQVAGADEEVAALEKDLSMLRQCKHPGVAFQVADLERLIATKRSAAHALWPPRRQQHRFERRAADAQADLEKATVAEAELRTQLDELQANITQASERTVAKRATAMERQVELDAFLAAEREKNLLDGVDVDRADAGVVQVDLACGGGPTSSSTAPMSPEALLQLLLASPEGQARLAQAMQIATSPLAGGAQVAPAAAAAGQEEVVDDGDLDMYEVNEEDLDKMDKDSIRKFLKDRLQACRDSRAKVKLVAKRITK